MKITIKHKILKRQQLTLDNCHYNECFGIFDSLNPGKEEPKDLNLFRRLDLEISFLLKPKR